MNRPDETPRDRTTFQLGVVPVNVVVQFVEPLTRDAEVVDTGATAATSGPRPASSAVHGVLHREGRGGTEAAARAGAAGRAAGRDHEQVRAELVDLVVDLGLRALSEPDREDDGADADEDPEHRQRRAQPVRADRVGRGAERVAPVHAGAPAVTPSARSWGLQI